MMTSAMTWLLDGDPAIRWQVMRDLLNQPDEVVAGERSRVASEGWGAQLLALQRADGRWPGDPYWAATLNTLVLLKDLGVDPTNEQVRRAIGLVRDNYTWGPEFGDTRFFEGEVEPCINARVVSLGVYFGGADDQLVDRLLGEQLADGGWNCYAPPSQRLSFHSTICVLEGLLDYETAKGHTTAVTDARNRGQAYLLERRLLWSLSTGAVINAQWTEFSFPPRWHYDVLRALDYFRRAGVEADPRLAEAIELVEMKRDSEGRWPLENPHPDVVGFDLEDGAGQPSRWNTLRALRVLRWYCGREQA